MPEALAIATRLGVIGGCDWRALRRLRGPATMRKQRGGGHLKVQPQDPRPAESRPELPQPPPRMSLFDGNPDKKGSVTCFVV